MSKRYVLPVEIEPLDGGSGYLATCDAIQGCLAEGKTVAEALENVEDVARVLLELRTQDWLGIPPKLEEAPAAPIRFHAQVLISAG